MNKIVCPACGLVNLDRFVTYPNCAGCGARLPDAASPQRGEFWRRPLQASWWATIIGVVCAVLGVVAVGITRDTSRREEGFLMVYAQVPRVVTPGQEFVTQFQFDTIQEGSAEVYEEVRFRLSKKLLQNFEVLGAEPSPEEIFETNGGKYLLYSRVQRSTPLRISLKARKLGEYRFNANIYSRDYFPVESRSFITVAPPAAAKQPGPVRKLQQNSTQRQRPSTNSAQR